MLRILLTRHGTTDYTQEGRIQGTLDVPLSEGDIRQAENLRDHLKDATIHVAYSSPLVRALQTTRIVCAYRDIPIIPDPRLKERDFGRFNGVRYEEVDTQGASIDHYLFYKKDPNDDSNPSIPKRPEARGETIEEVMAKMTEFYDMLKGKYQNITVLVMGHSRSNAYLLNSIWGIPHNRLANFTQHITCMNEITIYPPMPNGERHIDVQVINFRGHVI